jgi:hypothetical protein
MKPLPNLTTEPELTDPLYWDVSDPDIDTGEIIERIYDEVPDEMTKIADMIRYGDDDCEAGAMFRDLMIKFETRITKEIKDATANRSRTL